MTCFAVLENMTQFAIGFENGVVLLLRGDVSRDRFTKQKIIHEGSSSITGTEGGRVRSWLMQSY